MNPLSVVIWQDSLLQSYRNYQLVIQSFFIAVGIGLTALVFTVTGKTKVYFSTGILWCCGVVALYMMARLRRAIQARGDDVSYWQKELIRYEDKGTGEKIFVKFKVWRILQGEKKHYLNNIITSNDLSDDQISRIINESAPKIRNLLDTTFITAIFSLWILLYIISGVIFYSTWSNQP